MTEGKTVEYKVIGSYHDGTSTTANLMYANEEQRRAHPQFTELNLPFSIKFLSGDNIMFHYSKKEPRLNGLIDHTLYDTFSIIREGKPILTRGSSSVLELTKQDS